MKTITLARSVFFLRKALQNLRSSLLLTTLTISTTAVALFTLLLFFLLSYNALRITEILQRSIQISAYFNDNVPPLHQQQIGDLVSSFEGVAAVELVTTEQARTDFLSKNDHLSAVVSDLGINPFPASLEIKVSDHLLRNGQIAVVVEKLRRLPYFDDIVYGKTFTEYILSLIATFHGLGLGLGLMLILAVAFIINNTITLALYSKIEELRILSLVGASNIFLYLPFVLQAVLETTFAAVLAILLLAGTYSTVAGNLDPLMPGYHFALLPSWFFGAFSLASGLLGLCACLFALANFKRRLSP